ncbi:MAG: hypothetical protein KDC53_19400 [Saprospiraceae bacterium]|nr:hypothetical protein [Saprospiraceae bacterium]
MEDWELEFQWLRVQHIVKETMSRDKLPDLQAILYLVGIQELGLLKNRYTKEEKQDLMHIAVCKLLSFEGYYEFVGRDQDGWPHYDQVRPLPKNDVEAQERQLKILTIEYFKQLEVENGGFGI